MLNLFLQIARSFIWIIILLGLIMAGLRLTLANVGLFRAEIENWVSEEVVPGIGFEEIRCYWNGINPVLELEQIAIILADRSRPIAVDTISIEIGLWDSLILGTPFIIEMSGVIEKVTIKKDSDRRWWLNDISLQASRSSTTLSNVEDLLASIPHYLHLELRRLIIEDETRQRVHRIDDIFADIQNHENGTHMQLLANLPKVFGGLLSLKAILNVDQGLVHLQTEGFKFDPVTALLDVPVEALRRAEFGGEAWLELQDFRLKSVRGKINVDKGRYQEKLDEPALPFKLAVNFDAQRQADDWSVSTLVENILVDDVRLDDVNAQLRIARPNDELEIEGWVGRLSVSQYAGFGNKYLSEQIGEQLRTANLRGDIDDTVFYLQPKNLSSFKILARAEGLSSDNAGDIPGIDKLNAELSYADNRLGLRLTGRQSSVDFGEHFRAPIHLNRFNATVYANIEQSAATVSIPEFQINNDDIKLAGRLWLESDQSESPFLYLRAGFEDGVGSQKSKYLPVKLLPAEALEWLDAGILQADIDQGNLLFHGRLEDIEKLDQQKSGEFFTEFDIRDGEVLFDTDWPSARQANGRVMFHNMGVDIDINHLSYVDASGIQGRVSLPNFADASIEVDLSAASSAQTGLQSFLEMPIGRRFSDVVKNLQDVRGEVETKVNLLLPIANDKLKDEVLVDIQFNDNAFNAPNWGSQLSQINGVLKVTDESINARGIQAMFFKDPVKIDIRTDQKKQQTIVETAGLIDTRQLLNLLPENHRQSYEGSSLWNIDLLIANTPQSGKAPLVTILANSGMQGTAIRLPAPYHKTAKEARTTSARVDLRANSDVGFVVKLGEQIQTRGRISKVKTGQTQLVDLDVAFATNLKAEAPPGIRLYGSITELPVDEWIQHFQTQAASQPTDSPSLLPLLQAVDLSARRATLFGREVLDAELLLIQTPRGFDGTFNSSMMKGEFEYPWDNSVQQPVIINLEYLRLARKVGQTDLSKWLPTDFLNTRFRSQEFSYDDRKIFEVELDTSIDGDALLVDLLAFKHNEVDFKSTGYWLYNTDSKQHVSRLQVAVDGDELGQSVAALYLGDVIHNGTIDFDGELNWPGALINPSWDILKGKGRIILEDGILKDVEPGSGRFVGLLSLNALPRRLSLDFSDVLFDGMEFDEIKGDLELNGQTLYTKNTRMDGPAAEIKIIGETGLRERTYDQKVYVVPKIRQTLPVIGTITAGSAVGWGLLLLQNLFKSSIDDSLEVEYRITGSWDNPVIEAVNEPEPEPVEKEKTPGFRNFEK